MNRLIGGVGGPIMPDSRARCQDLQGTLLPCPSVKLKDKMLRGKDSNIWAAAQVSQRGTSSVGIPSSSWKGEKFTNPFQAVPNSMGYLEPLEDSTWSQNVDSAASMYPPPTLPLTLDLDAWGEDYQDLSSWCSKPQQDMVADTKGSSCTVQDDELNTPELGVQHEFNFTASCNMLKENNTLQYLSEGSGTSLLPPSPPLYVPEKSSFEEPVKKTDTDNTRSATSNEFFIDDGCVLSVSHEEEIVTSHNVEGLNLELVQTKEPINLYVLGVAHGVKNRSIGNYRSVGKDSLVVMNAETDKNIDVTMANCDANTDKIVSLGSLLGSDFCVRTEEHTNQLRAEEKLNLKNLLSGSSYHNDEIKSVDETAGCSTVASKMTDTVVHSKCEIITSSKANRSMMMETVGSEEGAVKFAAVDVQINATEVAGQKDTTSSMFRMDIPVKMGQQSQPVKSELTETTEHVEISAQSLSGVSLEPQMVGTHTSEGMLVGNLGVLPHMSLKEENAAERNLKLNFSTLWEGTEDGSINVSTPDVMELFVKQNENFDLISYLFSNPKELQQDLLPVNGDDRSSETCSSETIKVEPVIAHIEQSNNDGELFNTEGDAAVKVEVVRPFCTARSDTELSKSTFEPMELEEVHCSPKHTSDQLCEEQTRTNLKKDLKGNQGHQIQKGRENRNNIQPGSTLESRILQDGSDLRLKISKVTASTGQTSSTNGTLPQEQVSPKEHTCELEDLPLSKRTRRCPAKRTLPSTSEEKNETCSTNRSPQRRPAYFDGPWIPSKRTRLTSGESCERYRELRDKNNEASRKSRQNRKVREVEMKEYAAKLESDNQTLKIKADEMERLVKKLREALLEAVVKTKKQ